MISGFFPGAPYGDTSWVVLSTFVDDGVVTPPQPSIPLTFRGFFPGSPYGDIPASVFSTPDGDSTPVVTPSGLLSVAISYATSTSTIPVFDVGDTVRINATFTDSIEGTLHDPASVVFRLRSPAGAVTTPTSAKASTGVWSIDLLPTVEGTWRYRWEAPGVTEEGQFVVRQTWSA